MKHRLSKHSVDTIGLSLYLETCREQLYQLLSGRASPPLSLICLAHIHALFECLATFTLFLIA